MDRRQFIAESSLLALGSLMIPSVLAAAPGRRPVILMVSGWQDVNIGDIAHTPGLLHVLETYIPEAKIILWKLSRGAEVEQLLHRDFPKVEIRYGSVSKDNKVEDPGILDAFEKADIMIHGSGPAVVGQRHLQAWADYSDKPFGVYGTTIQYIKKSLQALLKKAAFVYTRETASLKILAEHGLKGDHISFAPDATFFMNILNEAKAERFLKDNQLVPQEFICAIPRLRKTPYYKIRPNNAGWDEEHIKQVNALNDSKKEIDHAKLREAMIAWVRKTGYKVLVCPEMTYEVDIMDELLIDPLPADVKPKVLKRGYWLPDEAASVYKRAHTVLSFECHSPIIADVNETPFFYLRQPEDTIKGQMYYDLGFDDWIFEIEQTTGKQIADRLLSVWEHYDAAKQKIREANARIAEIYRTSSAYAEQLLEA